MPRRIDIELTSQSGDGSWTWRAAGARQPRGTVASDVIPQGASVGAVLRAEVESGIDGLEVVAVLPPKEPRPDASAEGRIEVLGSRRGGPDVSVVLAPGARRHRPEGRPGRERAGRREGAGRGPHPGRRGDGGPGGGREEERRERTGGRPAGPTPGREGAGRERRPTTSTVHRNAVLARLRPEQLPVAEQLLRGGIPAVRRAIEEQNEAAKASGRPPVASEALLAMAEGLLPEVRLAEWKDRAAGAQASGRDLRLRELRAVVAASRTVTLDDDGRAMARGLQESLDQRVGALREEWLARIGKALDEGRVLDALRFAGRAPEPGTRCPADLAVRLAADAGGGMTAETAPEAWLTMLDAVLDSPVRRTVKPAGIPGTPEVTAAARNAAGLVPELARLLGIRVPPPPPRRAPARRP